jgi:ribosomal protein L21E
MTQVRVDGVDPNSHSGEGNKRFAGRIGEITGVSGQFVKVKFTDVNDRYEHFFLPSELSMM